MTREEALDILEHHWTQIINPDYTDKETNEALNVAIEALSQEPRKHGKWLPYEFGNYRWRKCSCCGKADEYINNYNGKVNIESIRNYCPNCGADMREVTDECID